MSALQESLRSVLREHVLQEGVPSGWKKGTVDIATRSGKESTQGYSRGNLAVHKPLGKGGKGWNLTHAPSGFAIVQGLVTQDAAIAIADGIAAKFPDFVKADAKQVQALAKKHGREIMQVINDLKSQVNKRKPSAKQQASQEKKEAEAKEAKAYFDKVGNEYDKLRLQFIRYSEKANLSLETQYVSGWYKGSGDVKAKEKAQKQEAFYKAFRALRQVIDDIGYGKKGLLTKKQVTNTETAIKKLDSAMTALKKVGVDVAKEPEQVQTYVVTWDQNKYRRDTNLGSAGPQSNGVIVDAPSAHEAETMVGDQMRLNPFYLKATVLK